MSDAELERALSVLGPLEARVMRLVWTSGVRAPFTVRDMLDELPELAYTTVLTTMRRLADKGLLTAEAAVGRKAYHYRATGGPGAFLTAESAREAATVIERYGDAALAAFADRLDGLNPDQWAELERLREQGAASAAAGSRFGRIPDRSRS